MDETRPDAITGGRCPICRAASAPEWLPFCSRRCADVDLSRWLRGVYAIPGEHVSSSEHASEAAPGNDRDNDQDRRSGR
jgi:endogenous inhibitor of DNA gyrase (YacG/DUF329 family)